MQNNALIFQWFINQMVDECYLDAIMAKYTRKKAKMARKTREELRLEQEQNIALVVEYNRTVLPYSVLYQLARAEKLRMGYKVELSNDGEAVEVTISAGEDCLGYPDEETIKVYGWPCADRYTPGYQLNSLTNLNDRVDAYREEQKRIAAIKAAALSKLTDEEKEALGLR